MVSHENWKKDRVGTWIDCYTIPEDHINLDMYTLAHGKPYDHLDAIMHAFKNYKVMEKNKYKKYTCSKLVGLLMMLPNWWKALPVDIAEVCEKRNYKLDKRKIA